MKRRTTAPSRSVAFLRELRARFERNVQREQERRRAEDLIRDELRDARATIIRGTQIIAPK
jgi:hypothetical protein